MTVKQTQWGEDRNRFPPRKATESGGQSGHCITRANLTKPHQLRAVTSLGTVAINELGELLRGQEILLNTV